MKAFRRKTLLVLALSSALSATLTGLALAAGGDLDQTFGGDGKVTTNFTSGNDGAGDVAIQADGKIVVAGRASGTGGFGRFALARYNGNGTLDTSFSGNGKVITNFTSGQDRAAGVAIQADGKIVAAGEAGGGGGRFALARYNANGSLDTTFGGDGKVTTNFTRGEDFATDVAIQADGRIVAAGTAGFGRFALARYKPNGALDTTFSRNGKVTTNLTSGADVAYGVAIQANRRIVAAGTANVARFALARYTPNGTLDTTFSGDGKVTTNLTGGVDIARGVAIQADGKIVAGGEAGFCCEWTGSFGLARYNPDGSLDTTFSGDGKVTTNFTSGDDVAADVAIQADGKIVAAGHAGFFGLGARFALARYKPDGTRDTTFSGDGKVTTNFTAGFDSADGVAIEAGRKIVAAGRAFFGEADGRFALARYLGE